CESQSNAAQHVVVPGTHSPFAALQRFGLLPEGLLPHRTTSAGCEQSCARTGLPDARSRTKISAREQPNAGRERCLSYARCRCGLRVRSSARSSSAPCQFHRNYANHSPPLLFKFATRKLELTSASASTSTFAQFSRRHGFQDLRPLA